MALAELPEGWRYPDIDLDGNPPLDEWRYFFCAVCGIVYDGGMAAAKCCPGAFLPMAVAPINESRTLP